MSSLWVLYIRREREPQFQGNRSSGSGGDHFLKSIRDGRSVTLTCIYSFRLTAGLPQWLQHSGVEREVIGSIPSSVAVSLVDSENENTGMPSIQCGLRIARWLQLISIHPL